MDAFLDPIAATWDKHTLEDVRKALQSHMCEHCGAEYDTVTAAWACEDNDQTLVPRD